MRSSWAYLFRYTFPTSPSQSLIFPCSLTSQGGLASASIISLRELLWTHSNPDPAKPSQLGATRPPTGPSEPRHPPCPPSRSLVLSDLTLLVLLGLHRRLLFTLHPLPARPESKASTPTLGNCPSHTLSDLFLEAQATFPNQAHHLPPTPLATSAQARTLQTPPAGHARHWASQHGPLTLPASQPHHTCASSPASALSSP